MSDISWVLIDKLFKDNPYILVNHHLQSYNDFFDVGIYKIFKENNPIRFIQREEDPDIKKSNEISLYMGGKEGNKIYFGKPVINDDKGKKTYMYPNLARLRNLTYSLTIHYDIDVVYKYYHF